MIEAMMEDYISIPEGAATNIADCIASAGLEPDQRMSQALELATCHDWPLQFLNRPVTDAELFHSLCRLNTRGFEQIAPWRFDNLRGQGLRLARATHRIPLARRTSTSHLTRIIKRACTEARDSQTLGTTDYLNAVVKDGIEHGESSRTRGHLVGALAKMHGFRSSTPLSRMPVVRHLLKALLSSCNGADDFQYALALNGERLVFRVISNLGDYVEEMPSGLLKPHRALLTHFDNLGLFTADSIQELEELINNRKTTENDLQIFFEKYPHFMRRWDHREVCPHVYLTREDAGPLIPDFILCNRDTQQAAIVELKRAFLKTRLVRHQDNRVRFASAIAEARAQLLEYKDWFEMPRNRELLAKRLGMEVYRPRLMVIIGRRSEFRDELERQKLQSREPEVDVVTYDDILDHARSRRVFIEHS